MVFEVCSCADTDRLRTAWLDQCDDQALQKHLCIMFSISEWELSLDGLHHRGTSFTTVQ